MIQFLQHLFMTTDGFPCMVLQGMPEAELYVVDLVEDQCRSKGEEEKISSSSLRRRLLGTLLREPRVVFSSVLVPYVTVIINSNTSYSWIKGQHYPVAHKKPESLFSRAFFS